MSFDERSHKLATFEVGNMWAFRGKRYFEEHSHKLAIFAVESFARLGVEGSSSSFVDQLAESVVGSGGGIRRIKSMARGQRGWKKACCLSSR